MKADERFAYLQYRRNRDVIRGKEGDKLALPSPAKSEGEIDRRFVNGKLNGKLIPPPSPQNEPDKEKKPFEDRVLKKALDYVRGEIKKADTGG